MNKFIGKIKNEPSIFLLIRMWKYAKGHRKQVVIYALLSFIANLILLLGPYIFGEFLNELQINGLKKENLYFLIFLLILLLVSDILFWLFHGPSRVIEKESAFKTQRNYMKYLYKNVLALDLRPPQEPPGVSALGMNCGNI